MKKLDVHLVMAVDAQVNDHTAFLPLEDDVFGVEAFELTAPVQTSISATNLISLERAVVAAARASFQRREED